MATGCPVPSATCRVTAPPGVPFEPDTQGGGAHGVQGDAAEGEGQAHSPAPAVLAAVLVRAGELGVEGGVEEGGVQSVAGRVAVLVLGQGDLGVADVTVAPGGAQALEDGAVLVALVGEGVVEAVQRDGGGAGGRPGGEGVAGAGGGGRGEDGGGVPGPGGVVVGVRAGVDGDGPAARVVGGAEHDLELHAVAVGQGERRFQGEFVEQAAADLVAGPQDEFDEGRAGQQDGAGDGVVGEPGLGAGGEPSGEQDPVLVGDADDGAQQGVSGARRARRR